MSELNDPRVLFAAERTLLAWTRTSLTLMAFGFVIERFNLFMHMLLPQKTTGGLHGAASFWLGLVFILFAAIAAIVSAIQYRTVLRGLNKTEVPEGYMVNLGVAVNLALAALCIALIVYLYLSGQSV
jgi:putative membrane protein